MRRSGYILCTESRYPRFLFHFVSFHLNIMNYGISNGEKNKMTENDTKPAVPSCKMFEGIINSKPLGTKANRLVITHDFRIMLS